MCYSTVSKSHWPMDLSGTYWKSNTYNNSIGFYKDGEDYNY